jgi:lipoate-protein ligase A
MDAASGGRNMAVDEAIMDAVAHRESRPTLRLYGWTPGCYSIGRYQRAADLTEEARAEPGVSWVRRSTGGRAVYHDAELTYAVVAPLADSRVSGAVLASYRKIAEALLRGLARLGIQAELAGCRDPARIRANPSCFDSASAYEVVRDGRKLSGSAQLRHGRALLQHGSILIESPAAAFFAGVSFGSEEERRRAWDAGERRLTTLTETLGRTPEPREVQGAIIRGFAECWGVDFAPGELSDRELETAHRLEREKYRAAAWCYRK